MTAPTTNTATGLAPWIGSNRKQAGYLLLGLALILAIVTLVFSDEYRKSGGAIETDEANKTAEKDKLKNPDDLLESKQKKEKSLETPRNPVLLARALWTGALSLVVFVGGILCFVVQVPSLRQTNFGYRLLFLIGGLFGTITALYGMVYLYQVSDDFLTWLRDEKSEAANRPIMGLGIFLAGTLMLFIMVQTARSQERRDSLLRQLMYGANTVVVGLLLFVALSMLNVFTGIEFPETIDTTESKFYTLDEKSVEIVSSLEEPVNAYFICNLSIRENYPALDRDVTSLLKNCERINPKFKAHFISPEIDQVELNELWKRLNIPQPERKRGLLVTMGENEDRRVMLDLSPDLIDGTEAGLTFQGESRLMTELVFLSQPGGKPVVYFTQGHGEVDIMAQPAGRKVERSAVRLRQWLNDRKFEVKTLQAEFNAPLQIPADAAAVVVLGPTRRISLPMEKSLHDYVLPEDPKKKAGRLILALPPEATEEMDKIGVTGLETILSDAGILPKTERVYAAATRPTDFTILTAVPNRSLVEMNHPMGRALLEAYLLRNVRTFESIKARDPKLQPMPLLFTDDEQPTWIDSSMKVDALSIVRRFFDQANAEETKKFRTAKQLGFRTEPIAMLVSEGASQPNPFGPPPTPGNPRMAIFGTDSIFLDELNGQLPPSLSSGNFELFTASLDWLRERPQSIGIKPREQPRVGIANRTAFSESRVILLPALWMTLAIVGMGLMIWVIRRK